MNSKKISRVCHRFYSNSKIFEKSLITSAQIFRKILKKSSLPQCFLLRYIFVTAFLFYCYHIDVILLIKISFCNSILYIFDHFLIRLIVVATTCRVDQLTTPNCRSANCGSVTCRGPILNRYILVFFIAL
jgi:hypothetical protein